MTQTFDVPKYWDRRYRDGRTSGAGSEGDEGAYKAAYVERFIIDNDVESVIDWGCGDGQVLALIELNGARYTGIDVSETIVKRMREKFPHRRFLLPTDAHDRWSHELGLSMDVLFHFPDDNDYCKYLAQLFGSATKYVVIYSTNYDGGRTSRHVMRREFTRDVAVLHPEWKLITIESPLKEGLASFFVYEKEA